MLFATNCCCVFLLAFSVEGIEFEFASVDAGREILQADDEFLQRLSPFDRQSRLQTSEPVSANQHKEFVAKNVLAWKDDQIEAVKDVLEELQQPLAKLNVANLPTVQFITTTGREESGAAYTRGNAIVLTRAQLQMNKDQLKKLVLHELFHVISRANPKLRDRLYAILGFIPSNEIRLPENLRDQRLTNPDAPVIQHVLRVKLDDEEEVFVAPVLYAKSAYDPNTARSMFAYLTFSLMKVVKDSGGDLIPAEVAGEAVMFEKTLADFRRQIGRNTQYIIHPEEVLADNFAELMLGNFEVPDPWILEQMGALMLR